MFHAIVFTDSESIGLEPRDIVIILNEPSNIPDLAVTVTINQSKSFHFIVDALGSELA